MSKIPEPLDYSKPNVNGASASATVPGAQAQAPPLVVGASTGQAPPPSGPGVMGMGAPRVPVPAVFGARPHPKTGVCSGTMVRLGPTHDLVAAIQCPVCLDTAFPPIFMCTTGHIVCGRCRPKVPNCGLCGAKIGATRNYSVEAIVSISDFHCPNYDLGCRDIFKGEHVIAHLKDCQFAEVLCDEKHGANMCTGVPLQIGKYLDHVKRIHQYEEIFHGSFTYTNRLIMIPGTGICQPTPCLFHPQVVYFDNRSFLVFRREIFGLYYTWVKMIGRETEAKNYCVKVTLKSNIQPDAQVEWTIPVHNIHVKFEQVQVNGLSAVISTSAIAPYLRAPPHLRQDGHHEVYWTAHFEFLKRNGQQPIRIQCPFSRYSSGSASFNPDEIIID